MLKDVVIANKTYAKLNVADEQQLDNIAVKVIRQDTPNFLVPLKMLEMDGEIELRYEMSDGLRLAYLPEAMSKKEFLVLFEGMVRPLVECGDWFLDYHNFYLNKNYILVGKNQTEVKFAYIPLNEQVQSDEAILDFLGEFVLHINLQDEPMYIMELYRRIKDRGATLSGILEFISKKFDAAPSMAAAAAPKQEKHSQGGFFKRSEPEPAAAEPKPAKPAMPSMPFMKEKPQKVEEAPKAQPQPQPQPAPKAQPETFGQDNIQGDLINSLFGEYEDEPKKKEKAPKKAKEKPAKSGGGLFGSIFGGSKAAEEEEPAYYGASAPVYEAPKPRREEPKKAERIAPVSNSMYEEDVTIIPDANPVASSTGNKLVLQLVEDGGYRFPQFVEIDMSKGYATVGRYDKNGNAQSDYNFDASLSFISRRHFRIEKMGDRYSIIDLGSANGTFVNNEELIPNMPKSVGAGERIIISRNHRIAFRVC